MRFARGKLRIDAETCEGITLILLTQIDRDQTFYAPYPRFFDLTKTEGCLIFLSKEGCQILAKAAAHGGY